MKNIEIKKIFPILIIAFSFLLSVGFMSLIINFIQNYNIPLISENVPIITPILLMQIILSFIVTRFKNFNKLAVSYILCFVISFLSIAFNSTRELKWIWSEFIVFHIIIIHFMIKFWYKIK